MGFLKNIIRNAVDDGISKGIKDAVSSATEKIVAPKAEAYANKVAQTFDSAAEGLGAAQENKAETKDAFSSLEKSLERLSRSAEKYAAAMENNVAGQEALLDEWAKKLDGFPVWCFGGNDFSIQESMKTDTSAYYMFSAENATQAGLDTYVALLKENGFVRKYAGSDEVLYKDLGGEYLVFGKTDAFGCAPTMTLNMGRTRDKSEIED